MKWIGLTGGMGSGKSSVAMFLRDQGLPVIDADEVSHFITSKKGPGLDLLVKEFGPEILDQSGGLDRRKLGKKVFADKSLLAKLEGILHPLIKQEVSKRRKEFEEKKYNYVIYDVPLMFEKKMQKDFDEIIVVFCSEEKQIERIQARDKLPLADIKKRLSMQVPLSQKKSGATFVIDNNSGEEELKSKSKGLIDYLKKKYGDYHAQE